MSLIPPYTAQAVVRNSPLTQEVGPNVVTRQLRDIFRQAFDDLGGVSWLVDFANESEQNRRVFVQAISKLLPASADPSAKSDKIVIDIPWLTRDRLAYKAGAMDSDVTDVLPRVVNAKL